jgi:hypothetical protein
MECEKSGACRTALEHPDACAVVEQDGCRVFDLPENKRDHPMRGWARPEALAILARRGPVWPWPSQTPPGLQD